MSKVGLIKVQMKVVFFALALVPMIEVSGQSAQDIQTQLEPSRRGASVPPALPALPSIELPQPAGTAAALEAELRRTWYASILTYAYDWLS